MERVTEMHDWRHRKLHPPLHESLSREARVFEFAWHVTNPYVTQVFFRAAMRSHSSDIQHTFFGTPRLSWGVGICNTIAALAAIVLQIPIPHDKRGEPPLRNKKTRKLYCRSAVWKTAHAG